MNRMRQQKAAAAAQGAKISGKTVKRLLSYTKKYRLLFAVVVISILLSAVAGVAGSMFLQVLIDNYITPMLLQSVPDFSGLISALVFMGGIYLVGIVTAFLYNRIMIKISEGTRCSRICRRSR